MRCLLITVKRNRRGQPIKEGRIIVGEELTIGRGSDCSIYLPNARVTLHQATIRMQDDGRLAIEAQGSEIGVDGAFTPRARLRPGTRVSIGPYEMVVELAGSEGYPEHDFALSVELNQAGAPERARRRALPTSLAAAGLTKRVPGLLLALVVLVLFLVLPVLHAIKPEFRDSEKDLQLAPVAADESWSPGPLAAGHRVFGRDCKACHTVPFEHVRDRECLSCHQGTGGHVANAALQEAAFGATRCAECHRDHRGLASMNDIDAGTCAACHGSIRAHAPGTTLPDISDFKTDHPAFRLSIANGPGAADVVRIAQTDKAALKQQTGLKFPHDVHLAKRGIESHHAPPGQNGRVVLQCRDCHTPEASGVGFRPISMQEHCADCHRLEFEPEVSSRQVPHGSEREVMLTLREFYASAALGTTPLEVTTSDGLLQRPGARPAEVRQVRAIDWATRKAQAAATDLFEVRVCVVCHDVRRRAAMGSAPAVQPTAVQPTAAPLAVPAEAGTSDGAIEVPWTIAPVVLTQHWMPKARFAHDKHAAVACTDCHAVTTSKSGSDVSMPDIATCRQCHVGSQPEQNRISSDCELCHGFHQHPGGLKGQGGLVAGTATGDTAGNTTGNASGNPTGPSPTAAAMLPVLSAVTAASPLQGVFDRTPAAPLAAPSGAQP